MPTTGSAYATRSQRFEERPPSFAWTVLRQELAFSRVRWQSAFKPALSVTLAIVLGYTFSWTGLSTAAIPPLLLSRQDVRYDLRQSLWTMAATAALGSFYYLSLNFSQGLWWFFLVLGGGLTVSGALSTLPNVGQAIGTAQIVTTSVLVTYFYVPNPPRQNLFLPTTVELLLGFGLALGVNNLLWPYSPRREWDERFERTWAECRRACARWFADVETPVGDGRLRRPNRLDRQLEAVLSLLHEKIKPTHEADPGPAVRAAAAVRLEEVVIRLQDLFRVGRGRWPGRDPAAFGRLGRALDARFSQLGRLLAGKQDGAAAAGAPPDAPPTGDAAKLVWPASSDGDGDEDDHDAEPTRRENLQRLCAGLDGSWATFRDLSRQSAAERVTRSDQTMAWTSPPRFADLRKLETASWRHGVRVALAALVSLGTWQALRLPAGGELLFLALLILQPDVGRSSRQAILCVSGVLLGLLFAFLSVAFVVKYVETIYGFGLCVFGALLFLSYLAGANARIAYAGFQGTISYVVLLVSSDRQSVSLEPLRERFVALTFGMVIALLIAYHLWPTWDVQKLFKTLADNFAVCARAWGEWRPWDRAAPRPEEGHGTFVQDFNRGWTQATQLHNLTEFEGGEGGPRFGYAGRLLTHEVALFEQLYLFGATWTEPAAAGASAGASPLPPGLAGRVREQMSALARRLGHPVELPPLPAPADGSRVPADGDEPPSADDRRGRVLRHRAAEIEQILTSLDRLTAVSAPVPTAVGTDGKRPTN